MSGVRGLQVRQLDYWAENSAKDWATGFDFDAVKRGLVKLAEAADRNASHSMQAFVFNLRRPQFQDPRVRRAFNLAFDFEWANKNLFYDQYARRRQLLRQLRAEGDRPAARAASSRS